MENIYVNEFSQDNNLQELLDLIPTKHVNELLLFEPKNFELVVKLSTGVLLFDQYRNEFITEFGSIGILNQNVKPEYFTCPLGHLVPINHEKNNFMIDLKSSYLNHSCFHTVYLIRSVSDQVAQLEFLPVLLVKINHDNGDNY